MTMFGKAGEPAKTTLPTDLKMAFYSKWSAAGFASEAEALRHLVAIYVYGARHVESLHLHRIRAMAGDMSVTGPSVDQTGAGA